MDVEYLNIASRDNPKRFQDEPPALSMLSTVVSASHAPEFVTIDAGLKGELLSLALLFSAHLLFAAMYKDGPFPEANCATFNSDIELRFSQVLSPKIEGASLSYNWWGDEHGQLSIAANSASKASSAGSAGSLKRARSGSDSHASATGSDSKMSDTAPDSEDRAAVATLVGEKLKLGSLVELAVSHCDPTVNLHDVFYVHQKGVVVDVWRIDARGKCQ